MSKRSFSEALFEEFCSTHGVPCEPIPAELVRTPDFAIRLGAARVVCEIKQIDPNAEDLAELNEVNSGNATGRFVPNRLRSKLKNVSGQLKAACLSGFPTLLVVYDNTPFKMYSLHFDVVQALFGAHSVLVTVPKQPAGETMVSEPFFGGNRGLTPHQNTSVSAVAILDGGPRSERSLRVYHNPYAMVVLRPELLHTLAVQQCVLPGATTVTL
ncbi:MAG: hypothetical protein LAO77_25925 [Acidobacteriia bacterium]|nr:hypothetical protein [Terriglobia bacterium]